MPNNPAFEDNKGLRDDKGKPEFHLIPSDALCELGRVYTFGAGKYAPYNWEKGMAWSRCFNSLLRHLYAYWDGQRNDEETGLHHMAHVAWNAIALLVYSIRGLGVDDRKTSYISAKRNAGEEKDGKYIGLSAGCATGVESECSRENLAASKARLPIARCPSVFTHPLDAPETNRLDEIQRPQPVGSIAEIKEGLKFKVHGNPDVWTITRLIMSSLNTFAARCGAKEEMFHIRAIAEIVP